MSIVLSIPIENAFLDSRKIPIVNAREADSKSAIKIGIINIMPKAEEYEKNLLFALGKTDHLIEPVWIRLSNHSYSSSNKEHIEKNYIYFDDAIRKGIQGLILSPAPVEDLLFEEVTYWNEILDILKYAEKNLASTLGLCWGGLALAKYLGIEKENYEKKIFGVYKTSNLLPHHIITENMDDSFYCPQSRHAGISDDVLEAEQRQNHLTLLCYTKNAGYTVFESNDKKFLMHLGHPEYHTTRLVEEYARDIKNNRKDVPVPFNVNLKNPENMWRSHSKEFFSGWIKTIITNSSV
ncbi:MAG: homoserine O-succinyltransferase [Nanoarchaeota archaeon]|nr:homoserine O-succinyltransferase [Nanoarchaeota archaeon]